MKEKFQKEIIRASILLLSAALMASCSKEDSEVEPTPVPTPCEIVKVSAKIDKPTVWEPGSVYLIEGSGLRVESSLTIKPGTVVKLRNAAITILKEGRITAEGTPDRRIVFTSLADDRYCGDTNGDNMATKPEKGDWISIDISGSIGSVFRYVDIFYAGQTSGGTNRAVDIGWAQSASFTFDNCRIAHTMDGARSDSQAFFGSSSMVDQNISKFTNNAMYDNGKPIYFNAFYTLDPSNVFHDPENPSVKNSKNGIYLYGSVLDRTVSWNNTEVPYVVDQFFQVFNSATIKIGPDVVVKFKSSSGGIQRNSPQNITLDPKAILTSYKDDSYGGDTNGDGKASSPEKGDWLGFRSYSTTGPNWQQGSNILYSKN